MISRTYKLRNRETTAMHRIRKIQKPLTKLRNGMVSVEKTTEELGEMYVSAVLPVVANI